MQLDFLDEARAYEPQVRSCLDALSDDVNNREALEEIFRLAHTIRGSSGTAGLDEAVNIAQSAEELAEAILDGDLPMDVESVDLFREAFARIFAALGQAAKGAAPPRKSNRSQMQETVRVEDIPPELVEGFLIEAAESLVLVATSLREFEQHQSKKQTLKDARRGVHTIKGAGGMVGLWALAKLAKRVEDVLDEVYDGDRDWSHGIRTLIFDSYHALNDLVGAGGLPRGQEDRLEALHAAYDKLASEPVVAPIASELLEGFLLEAAGLLNGMDTLLEGTEKRDVLQEVRRRIHTIKGAAGMVGLPGLSRIAHRMEDVLDRLYDGAAAHDSTVQSLLIATNDAIADIVCAGGSTTPFEERLACLYRRYDTLGVAPGGDATAPEPAAVVATSAEAARHVHVPMERLDELVRRVGELFVVHSSFDRKLGGYRRQISELELTLGRLRRIASVFETEYAIYSPGVIGGATAPTPQGRADRSEFDALELDRYTKFHLLSRDLTEATSDIATAGHLLSTLASDFDGSFRRQGRLTSDIQDRLMHLRMVPLTTIAARLQRAVRVTAERTGKQVDLTLEGFSSELDKTALEQLVGPLEHLLRNAVDHGIEPREARLAAGKQEKGSIRIAASYEGTQVVIRISDDGAGLDPTRVAEAATRRGLINAHRAATMDPESLFPLIFEAGFTTSETITEISGRGVGLEVVKSVVESLKGTVTVTTEAGQWTTFTLRLPMSLTITKVLIVEANQETFALPLGSVAQVARVDYGQVETIAGKRVVRHLRRLIPAVWLGEALSLPGAPVQGAKQSLVVIQAGADRHALMVDRIVEARQVMVNPPTGVLLKAPAVAGVTLMGDGSVVLVLNPAELVAPPRAASKPAQRPVQTNTFDVLVVDDSLSVRRVVSNLITKSGWNPVQAKDGVEALEVLGRLERKPDVILLDVEMPRMDGYEFAAIVRATHGLKQIPIIMLTSRAGDKHRKRAIAAGVNGYLVKPYQDDHLTSMVKEWVARSRGEI